MLLQTSVEPNRQFSRPSLWQRSQQRSQKEHGIVRQFPQSEQQGVLRGWNVMEYSFPVGQFVFQHFLFPREQRPVSDELFCLYLLLIMHPCLCSWTCQVPPHLRAPSSLGPGISTEFVSRTVQTICNLSIIVPLL